MMRLLLFSFLFVLSCCASAQKVYTITIDGDINPASAEFIANSIKQAGEENAECLILHLNTPGGLLPSTRSIVSAMLQSPVPVISFVYPSGAHAGSAGVFITMAAHFAAMAPGTNIGAAHPVSLQGSVDSTMNAKATNDAVAFIKSIAKKRNRNSEWAEEAVRNSFAITEDEALQMKVIDAIARSDEQLLLMVNGKTAETSLGTKTLHTTHPEIIHLEMSFFTRLLNILANPNIAYILMMIGFYGIIFEFYSPGAIFPGIIGVISLVLAFYAMNSLPVNIAGIALIVFSVILFLLEIKITSHGILTIGAILSLLLGSMILFRSTSAPDVARLSWGVIIPCVAITTLFFLFVVGMGIKAQKNKPLTGLDAMIGEKGKTLKKLNPEGTISVQGEVWKAQALAGNIEKDTAVIVKAVNDFVLIVEEAPV